MIMKLPSDDVYLIVIQTDVDFCLQLDTVQTFSIYFLAVN